MLRARFAARADLGGAWSAVIDRAVADDLGIRSSTLAQITLLRQVRPLAIGLALAAMLPRVADQLARVAWAVFFAGFALALVFVMYKGAPMLVHTSPLAIVDVGAGAATLPGKHLAQEHTADLLLITTVSPIAYTRHLLLRSH